jgi:hypothetical protein
MKKNNINTDEINNFFSRCYYFSNDGNINSYLYSFFRDKIISEKDRAKIILKLSCCSVEDSHGQRYHNHVHPVRFMATRMMHYLKNADSSTVLRWMNSLQSNDVYKNDLLKSVRISGIRLTDKWQSSFVRIWSTPYGLNWKFKNVVVIVPDIQTTKDYMYIDSWKKDIDSKIAFNSKRSFMNKNGTYPFSLLLDLDDIAQAILENK